MMVKKIVGAITDTHDNFQLSILNYQSFSLIQRTLNPWPE
jgi:hypothetical protein